MAQTEFKKGALAGHATGRSRSGQYVAGEEDLGFETTDRPTRWVAGYRYGYRLGAEGESLDLPFDPDTTTTEDLIATVGRGRSRDARAFDLASAALDARCGDGTAWKFAPIGDRHGRDG